MLENHTMIYQKVSNRIISVWNIRLHWLTIVVFLCFIQIFWLTDLLSKTGWHETRYKCGALRIRRHFIEELWEQSALLPEDEWRTMARQKLVEFEDQLHEAFSAGLTSYSGKRTWGYWDGVAFSMTTVSTIGKALNFELLWFSNLVIYFWIVSQAMVILFLSPGWDDWQLLPTLCSGFHSFWFFWLIVDYFSQE